MDTDIQVFTQTSSILNIQSSNSSEEAKAKACLLTDPGSLASSYLFSNTYHPLYWALWLVDHFLSDSLLHLFPFVQCWVPLSSQMVMIPEADGLKECLVEQMRFGVFPH